MCGIAGYAGPDDVPPDRISGCLALMKRRGPDQQESCSFVDQSGRTIVLLASRLSIIDLDARSSQPFGIDSRTIAFNGELYNYVEVARSLRRRMRTTSDTEVFLSAVIEQGWSALDGFEGMWAAAVYDATDGSLTLSRDRFGEKPLFIHRDGRGGIYFGSEPKFVFALVGHRLPIDHDQLGRYLVNGYKSLYKQAATFFEGLEELSRSTFLRVDREGAEHPNVYWTPPLDVDDAMTYDDAVAGVRDLLTHAVRIRLRADVPLAFCMSGGVDSNALIGVACRLADYDVHGYTIRNTDTRYEETAEVEEVTSALGIRHTWVDLDIDGFLPSLRAVIRGHDGPVATISYYAHWLLMRSIAADGYRVSVSGTGADELFTGYYDHHLMYLAEVKSDGPMYDAARRAWEERIRPLVRNPYLQDADTFVRNPIFRDHIFLDAPAFATYLQAPKIEPFREERYSRSLLRNRMLNELFHEAVPVILHEDDLNAMYFSIENRSPYLDRALHEFTLKIPVKFLVRDGLAKAILRDAVRDLIPSRVLFNPRKVGFNAPIEALLDTSDPSVRDLLLAPSPVFDYVRRDRIAELIDEGTLPNSKSKFLFYFLNTKLFLEDFG